MCVSAHVAPNVEVDMIACVSGEEATNGLLLCPSRGVKQSRELLDACELVRVLIRGSHFRESGVGGSRVG